MTLVHFRLVLPSDIRNRQKSYPSAVILLFLALVLLILFQILPCSLIRSLGYRDSSLDTSHPATGLMALTTAPGLLVWRAIRFYHSPPPEAPCLFATASNVIAA